MIVGKQVLRVRAVDGDRDIGNTIVYSIVSGPVDIFTIDPETGVVHTAGELDRESQRATNGAFIVTIEAKELGSVDEQTARTQVTIIIEVGDDANLLSGE